MAIANSHRAARIVGIHVACGLGVPIGLVVRASGATAKAVPVSIGPSNVCPRFCHDPASNSSSVVSESATKQRLDVRDPARVWPAHRPVSLQVCWKRIRARSCHRQRVVVPRVGIGERQLSRQRSLRAPARLSVRRRLLRAGARTRASRRTRGRIVGLLAPARTRDAYSAARARFRRSAGSRSSGGPKAARRIPHRVCPSPLEVRADVRSEPLFGEHVLKALQYRNNSWALELAERLHQALHIDSAKLIERNDTRAALKAASRAPRIRASASGHGRNDDRAKVLVQFVRRHDHARPRLLDFTAQSRI